METHPLQTSFSWKLLPHWAEPDGLTAFNSLWTLQREGNLSKHFGNEERNVCTGWARTAILVSSVFLNALCMSPAQQKVWLRGWANSAFGCNRPLLACRPSLFFSGYPTICYLAAYYEEHACWHTSTEKLSNLKYKLWLKRWTVICFVCGCQIWAAIVNFFVL